MASVCLLGASSAQGYCNKQRCVTTVKQLYVPEKNRVWIEPSHQADGKVNCTPSEKKFLTLYDSHPRFREIYSALLAATVSKTTVNMRIQEGSGDCKVLYISVHQPD